MRQFTDFEVYAQLKKWETTDGGTLTEEDYQRIIDIYGRVINDDVNKNKGKLEQESMITYLADSVQAQIDKGASADKINETWTYIENHFSDNKHFEFYQHFMGDYETKQLQEAIINNKLPSSILQGIKAVGEINMPPKVFNNKVVEIKGYFDPSPENGDETENWLTIICDGKTIFDWNADAEEDNIVKYKRLSEKEFEILEKQIEENRKRKNTTKQGKPTRSQYVKTYFIGEEVVQERITSKNQTIFQDRKGRFVSRSKVL